MRSPEDRAQMLRDLKFALDVMEERSHLGLDNERAKALKIALLQRINVAQQNLHHIPTVSNVETDKLVTV